MVKVPPDRLLGSRCRLLSLRAAQCALYAHAPGMDEPLHDVRCNMGHEGVLRLGGDPPACDPMSNSPPARERGCCKLLSCPGTALKTEASRALDFLFRLRFSSRNRHRAKKAEASRAHRPLARSLKLPRVAQDRRERMTTPYAALAPQYNKSQEGQLSRLYFNGLWQIQPRATSPLMEYGELNRGMQSFNGLPQTQPHRPALRGWR